MARLLRASVAALALATALLTWADLAAACSCADRDERDRLQDGEIGVLGTVLERHERYDDEHPTLDGQPLVSGYDYRLRVRRGVGARFGSRITVRVPEDGCGPGTFDVGERLAAFVRRRGYGWLTNGCSVPDAADFERALRPYPRARGHGRLALVAGGRFGNARLMGLDARGRILAYGFGAGEVQRVSVCPGSQRSAELVVEGKRRSVAVRDLRTLGVLWSVKLPLRSGALYEGAASVRCADPSGASVYGAAVEDTRRTTERTRVLRLAPGGAVEIATVRGYAPQLGLRSAYLTDLSHRLLAVSLADGAVRRLARLRYFAEALAESPDGRRLAYHDGERLRVRDLGSGRERSRRIRFGGPIAWLSSERFLFRGGEGRVYDASLKLQRRYRFFRLYHQAQVGDSLFGTDRFRLGALDLGSGRRRTVGQLPDRGITALEGVPGGPAVEAERRAPGLGFPAPARGARACRPSARG